MMLFILLNIRYLKNDWKGLFINSIFECIIENEISNKVIGGAIQVHAALGPGLLESAYQERLFYVLKKGGLSVVKQKPMPLVYEEVQLECGYRIDLLL